MEKSAIARYVRISPKKVKILLDEISGQKVEEVLNMLHFTQKHATEPVEKAVRSAVANIINEKGSTNIDTGTLFIKEARVSKGPTLKRYQARSMGRANVIRKRMSHIYVTVSDER